MTGISVIIPVLRDDEALARLLTRLASMDISEVIIADAEPREHLPANLTSPDLSITHISTQKGRGPQIKAGIDKAKHPYIWVLHADTLPDPKSPEAIQTILSHPQNSLSIFTLTFDRPTPLLRVFSWFARWESPLSTFGDQGYAFRRSDYQSLDISLENLPLLEDVVLRRTLKQKGRIKRSPLKIITSARRFEKYGVLKTQWLNCLILWRFWRGETASTLYDIYYGQHLD